MLSLLSLLIQTFMVRYKTYNSSFLSWQYWLLTCDRILVALLTLAGSEDMVKWVSLYCPHTSISREAINVEGGKVAGLFAVESWNQSREVPGPSSDGSHYWETAPLVNSSHRCYPPRQKPQPQSGAWPDLLSWASTRPTAAAGGGQAPWEVLWRH